MSFNKPIMAFFREKWYQYHCTVFFRAWLPRESKGTKKHSLTDIIVLTVIVVVCGAESWDAIELFGKTKIDFLRPILSLRNGIPPHGNINWVFSMLNPVKSELLFTQWSKSLKDKGIKQLIEHPPQ